MRQKLNGVRLFNTRRITTSFVFLFMCISILLQWNLSIDIDNRYLESRMPYSNKMLFESLLDKTSTIAVPDHDDLKIFEEIRKNHKKILGFGQGGREFIDTIIHALATIKEVVVVMEVGVWFGQSLARWLEVSPAVRVIGVDPFSNPSATHKSVADLPEDIRNRFGDPLFNRALAQYQMEKLVPGASKRALLLTGFHPDASTPIFQSHRAGTGPDVDVFYLDGGKGAAGHAEFLKSIIEGILHEFPDVIVAGDDWGYDGRKQKKEAFQGVIRDIAKKHGRIVQVSKGRTWLMMK